MRFLNVLPMMLAAALAGERVDITVDATAARPLKAGIFSTATIYDNGGLRPEDPLMADLMRAIRPAVLRLPAGNTANYWDWNAGAPCTPEQLRRFGADPNYSLARKPVGGRADYLKKLGGPMVAERWAKLAAQGGAEPLWTLNVSTVGPDETRRFLLHLKAAGLPANRFELGNELYHSNHWGREVPKVEDYIRKAKAHAREVKVVFPKAEVGVCVNANDDRVNGPLVKAAPDRFKPAPLNKWNAGLSKESFYDAVVIHLYFKSEELKDLDTVSADEYARWAIVRGSAFSVEEILAWPGRLFPGKKIWATEWNLNNRLYKVSHPKQNYRFLPEHTVLSGLFAAHFMLNAASAPSSLEVANYWQLNSGPDFGLMAGDPPVYRPAFHVLRMLAPAARECDRIGALEIPGAPVVRGPREFSVMKAAAVSGYIFFDQSGARYLAFRNFTGQRFPLRLRGVAGVRKKVTLESLSGESLLPSWNNPANPPPERWAPPYGVVRKEAGGNAIDLEPYSFSVITLAPAGDRAATGAGVLPSSSGATDRPRDD